MSHLVNTLSKNASRLFISAAQSSSEPVGKPSVSVITLLNRAAHFTDEARRILDADSGRAICSMVSAITELAMVSRDVLHIEVKFSAHINELEVKAFDAKTDYMASHHRLFGRSVYLDSANALDALKQLEDELIDLIADAKDKAMGGC